MTNLEKFKEVFEKTFGFTPDHWFPCPEKCPEKYTISCSDDCPYARFEEKEYEEPSELNLEVAKIAVDLGKILSKYSPVPVGEVIGYLCIFMDTLTGDDSVTDFDLTATRCNMAEKFFKEWPHSAEYYERQKRGNDK